MPNPSPEKYTSSTGNAANHIDVVLFDYGMVLSGPPDPAAWAIMRTVTGVDEIRLHTAYWRFRHDYDRGALTGPAYWHAVAEHAGITLDGAQMAKLLAVDIDLWTNLNLPMVEWAGRLQRAGIRTGILSNIGDCIADGIVKKLPWLAGFEHCTWSHALFMAKPEPAIYIETAQALNTAPAKILFIDDRRENIDAAAAIGMQTIHYTSHAAFEREMRERGFTSLLYAGSIHTAGEGPSSQSLEHEPEPAAK